MKNFAEELAYWYFRLNGFILIDNFVLHGAGLEENYHADVDLLGVRHKYAYELVGGQTTDCDERLMKHFCPNKHIGILCEVKSGLETSPRIRLSDRDRIKYAVQRIGLFSTHKSEEIAKSLAGEKVYVGDYNQIGKILISNDGTVRDDFICISLKEIETFLINHLDTYSNPKNGGKLLFPSTLIQYFLWKSQHNKSVERER